MASVLCEQQQWVDTSGAPLVGGFVYIGTQGNDPVANPKAIFSDRALTVALANPQTLDSLGQSTNKIWTDGTYSMKIEDLNNVQIYLELDNGETAETGTTTLSNVQGADTITADASATITAYTDLEIYTFTSVQANTGAVTLNIDSVGAKSVLKNHTEAIEAGDFEADQVIRVAYNATDDVFEWTNQNIKNVIADIGLLPQSYLSNVQISNNVTDADHDLDFTAFSTRDSTNAENIVNIALTKQFDTAWAAGTDAGGLASSLVPLVADTWYHVFAVLIGGAADIIADTSLTCANGVTDASVTNFRRICSFMTDGTTPGNILAFRHLNDQFWWDDAPYDINDTSTGTAAKTDTISTPIDIKTTAIVAVQYLSGTSPTTYGNIWNPDQTDPGTPGQGNANFTQVVSNNFSTHNIQVMTNTSSQIQYQTSASGTVNVQTAGWIDTRDR